MKKIILILLCLILVAALLLVIFYYDEYKAYRTAVKPYRDATKRWEQLENKEIDALIDEKNIIDSKEKREAIEEFAVNVGYQIVIINGLTFTFGMEDFVTNSSGHAKLTTDQQDTTGKYVKLDTQGIKEAVISRNIKIPAEATHLRFSYKFLKAEDNGVLEGFINENAFFHIYTEDYKNPNYLNFVDDSKDWACTEWIQLVYPGVPSEYNLSGQTVALSFRLTNFKPSEKSHIVLIDDIYFAKIGP